MRSTAASARCTRPAFATRSGIEFNPKDNTLWFTDNQTDGMGDNIPAGELNRATAAGQFFGYPYICGTTRITGERLRQGSAAGEHSASAER